jgi:hypothetical protein
MDYLLILLSGLILGYWIGQVILIYKLKRIVKHNLELDEIVNKPSSKKTHVFKLFVEIQRDMLYLYDFDNKEFICQAKSIEDLAKLAKEYKKIEYASVLYGEEILVFINGSVKKTYES